LKLIESKHQLAQSDSRVQELSAEVENKVAQVKEMGQKLEDALAAREVISKEKDQLSTDLQGQAERFLRLNKKYETVKGLNDKLSADVVQLTQDLGDARAANRVVEDQAITRAIDDYLNGKDFELLVAEKSVPYLRRGMLHAARTFIAQGSLHLSNQEIATQLSVGSQHPDLLPLHSRIPFDEEELSYIALKNQGWIVPVPELGNVVSCLDEVNANLVPADSTRIENDPESGDREVDSQVTKPV
jgi:Skp family chaperone for outer membrane proteins